MAGTYLILLMKIIFLFPGSFVHVVEVLIQRVAPTYLVCTTSSVSVD